MYRHAIQVLLTVVCLVMLTSVAFAAGELNNPLALKLNTALRLEIMEGESVWLSYTPTKTATYQFSSNTNGDPDCTLYEDDPTNEIDFEDDSFEGNNVYDFYLICTLTKNVKYYFEVLGNEDTQGTVKLTMDPFYAMAVGEAADGEVEYGDQVTLEVEAGTRPGNEISYLWTDDKGEPLEGDNTGSQYVIESFTLPAAYYYCQVSDGTNSTTVQFYIWFDNHLQAKPEKTTLIVHEDEPAVLKVMGHCDHGALSYRWSYVTEYKSEFDEITEEETTIPVKEYLPGDKSELPVSAADVPPQSVRTYYCDVSDTFGHSTSVKFQVRNDNGLTVDIKGSSVLNVSLHGDVALEVVVSVDRGGFTREWFMMEDEDNSEYTIKGETTEKLVLRNVTEPGIYVFRAKDEYGNEASARFDVRIDNKLSVKPVGLTHRCVPWGSNVTLKVQASCKNGECLICWSEYEEDFDVGSSVTLYGVEEERVIVCTVWDDYDNVVELEFIVEPNVFLQASTSTTVTVKYGQTAKLGVKTIPDSEFDPDDIEYSWEYEDDEGEWNWLPEGDARPTLTTEKLYKTTLFRCSASSPDYYTDEMVYFLVQVKDPVYSEYSHNLKMSISFLEGYSSVSANGKYFFNVENTENVTSSQVFRSIVIENRNTMMKKLRGNPNWSIVRLSGTVPMYIEEETFENSKIAYHLCVARAPKEEETAKYRVRCIWDTEMWQKDFTIKFTDLKYNLPEDIKYLGDGKYWTETVGQPFIMEECFGFKNQWTPAAEETLEVSCEYITDNVIERKMVSGVNQYVTKKPGIYNFYALITIDNLYLWEPVTLYSLRVDGSLSDGDKLKLPSALKNVEESTFEKTKAEIVIIPDGCSEIGPRAFAGSENLKQIVLPASVTSIDPTAFEGCGEMYAVVPADASADALAETAEAMGLTVLRQ